MQYRERFLWPNWLCGAIRRFCGCSGWQTAISEDRDCRGFERAGDAMWSLSTGFGGILRRDGNYLYQPPRKEVPGEFESASS
jgi:hypothetical protein